MESQMGENVMGQTRQEQAEKISRRREIILKHVGRPGGTTGNKLAKMLGVTRALILKDISALRRAGHPIQISSMIQEDGMMVAVYELPRYLMPENMSARNVEPLSRNASIGDQSAERPAEEYVPNAAEPASITSAGRAYGAAASGRRSKGAKTRSGGQRNDLMQRT